MTCNVWFESIAAEDIDTFHQFMQTEPCEGDRFPMTFLKDALEDNPFTGELFAIRDAEDCPLYLSDFDRVKRFFTALAKAVPSLMMFAYGFLDRGDPAIAENAPPDYGGLFWIELFGDGSADFELNPF